MARFFKFSLLLLLLVSFQTSSALDEAQKKAVKKALEMVGKAAKLLGPAMEIFEMVEGVYSLFAGSDNGQQNTDEKLDEINQKIDEMFSEMKSMGRRLEDKMDDVETSRELQGSIKVLHKRFAQVDNYYVAFEDFLNDTLVFREDTIERFARTITDYDDNGLNTILRRTHDAFVSSVGKTKNIPTLLTDPKIVHDFMCVMNQSPQQILHTLYQRVMLNEVKGLAMINFANIILDAIDNVTQNTSAKMQAENWSKDRMTSIFKVVKPALAVASREISRCDPAYPIEENQEEDIKGHYARLGPVFQRYVMHEADAHEMGTQKSYECSETCEFHKNVWHKCKEGGCDPQHCYGNVRECTNIKDQLSYCLAFKDDSYRRYQYMTVDGKEYGLNRTCEFDENKTKRGHGSQVISSCHYCMCTCEDTSTDIDKYISLQLVTSDYMNNYVITGARLKLQNNMLHIEIKHAKLKPYGRVDMNTEEWEDAYNFTINDSTIQKDVDYAEITWDEKTMCLDDVDYSPISPAEPRVLTGLRFKKVGDWIQLETQLSQFNYVKGKIINRYVAQESNDNSPDRRDVFPMDELDLPTRHKNKKQRSASSQYFEWTTSGLEQDAGQNVLPFIDIQEVYNYPSALLSGAGLFIRADDHGESGGYLALKLFTSDVTPFMQGPKKQTKRKTKQRTKLHRV